MRQAWTPDLITEFAANHVDDDALEAALKSAESLLAAEVNPQDVVLIKGSHGMGLYRLAEQWAVGGPADE